MLAADPRSTGSRVDERAGIRERAAFFGEGSNRLFGVLYAPLGDVRGAMVVCPATLAESLTTYRHDVMLGRTLAARGTAVLRFHYAGTGHSEGDPTRLTYESMRRDALSAADELADALGLSAVGFAGSRLGAMVAAGASARRDPAPLVLWEPVLDGRRYFREAWRARAIFGITEGSGQAGTGLGDVLERDGVADLLGYPLHRALHDSASGRVLLDDVGTGHRPVLIVHGETGTARRAEIEAAAGALRERGCAVELVALPYELVWWFIGPARIREVTGKVVDLVGLTGAWLERLRGEPA